MRSQLWILYAMLVAYAASVALFYVFARYRYPLVPLLVLFAAAGIVELPVLVAARCSSADARSRTQRSDRRWPDSPRSPPSSPRRCSPTGRCCRPTSCARSPRTILASRFRPSSASTRRLRTINARLRCEPTTRPRTAISAPRCAPRDDCRSGHCRVRAGAAPAARVSGRALQSRKCAARAGTVLTRRHGTSKWRCGRCPGLRKSTTTSASRSPRRGGATKRSRRSRPRCRADPSSARAHRNLGDLLAAAGRGREALDHFRRATELAPDDAATPLRLRQRAARSRPAGGSRGGISSRAETESEFSRSAQQPRHRARIAGKAWTRRSRSSAPRSDQAGFADAQRNLTMATRAPAGLKA